MALPREMDGVEAGELRKVSVERQTNRLEALKPVSFAVEVFSNDTYLLQCERHMMYKAIKEVFIIQERERYSALLGAQLADLHIHNQQLREKMKKEGSTVGQGQMEVQFVDQFGFHTVTCCGNLPQVNNWCSYWVSFFARQRIQPQMLPKGAQETGKQGNFGHSFRLLKMPEPPNANMVVLKIHSFFCGVEIVSSLLHGDLWGANVAEDDSGPIFFGPSSFYGHSEYDLSIAGMFGGFSSSFYSAYHSKIPKAAGFEKCLNLYQLFHYMNHWNHFGSGTGASVQAYHI
ncbi:hypothetical protein DV515_00011217, partial [Chloebia gouldiae]